MKEKISIKVDGKRIKATLDGHPEILPEHGFTTADAVGTLVLRHPEIFNVELRYGKDDDSGLRAAAAALVL